MVNLTYLVENYRLKSGIVGTAYDQQLLQFAIDGYKKLRDLGQVKMLAKAVALTVTDHKANLPPDFIQLIRMGICRCGVMIQFDAMDDLCLPHQESCACTEESVNNCFDCAGQNNGNSLDAWAFPVFGQPYSYSYTVGSYAIGVNNFRGGYKIDWRNNQIIFDNCVQCDTVVLEYFGDFMQPMGGAFVPENIIEPLVLWLDYERKYWSPEPSVRREASGARMRWYQATRDLNALNQAMNKHNWIELFREFFYQSVKT